MRRSGEVTCRESFGSPPRRAFLWSALVTFSCMAALAQGQIYQWEYVDPGDPSQGKRQSSVPTPDGATANPKNPSSFVGRDHTKAYLPNANLYRHRLAATNLDEAYLVGADLRSLQTAAWTGRYADLSGANLSEARLGATDLTGANLSNANLSNTFFEQAVLTDVDFTGANIEGAQLWWSKDRGFTADQLYQTASYQQGQLGAIWLLQSDLRGWDFSHQSMVGARLYGAELEGADFTDAVVTRVDFEKTGLVAEQLYSTTDYKSGVLDGIRLGRNDLSGWDFSHQSLKGAQLLEVQVSNTVFDGADLSQAAIGSRRNVVAYDVSFRHANLDRAQFDRRSVWERADFTGAVLTQVEFGSFRNSRFDNAVIRGAKFELTEEGFTLANFLSTASYKSGQLTDTRVQNSSFQGIDFSGKNLARIRWTESHFDAADFRGARLIDAELTGSMEGSDFQAADLTRAHLTWPGTPRVNFRSANLSNASMGGSRLQNIDVSDATILGTDFTAPDGDSDLTKEQLYSTASYKSGQLGGVVLGGDMRGWDFRGQDLTNAFFDQKSQLQEARWEGATLVNTAFFLAETPGADFRQAKLHEVLFSSSHLENSDFRATDLTKAHFVKGAATGTRFDGAAVRSVLFHGIDLTGASFRDADLHGSRFAESTLTDVDFQNASIRLASFRNSTARGFTREMLESTRSYKERALAGINLGKNDMGGWDFRGQDLRGADFRDSSLQGALFDLADMRGALVPSSSGPDQFPPPVDIAGADLSRTIRADGRLDLLRIDAGETFTIRNAASTYNRAPPTDIPVGTAVLNGGGTLQVLFSGQTWQSTLLIPDNVSPYDLDGVLQLGFDRNSNVRLFVGKSFKLFDWPQVELVGEFNILSEAQYKWDVSQLYSHGTVRLVSIVPEPSTVATGLLLALAGAGIVRRRHQ